MPYEIWRMAYESCSATFLVLLAAAARAEIVAPGFLRRFVRRDWREVIPVQVRESPAVPIFIVFIFVIPIFLIIPISVILPLIAEFTILEPRAHLHDYVLDQMIPLGK